jgi:predicted RNA binding protein YcfA (HicA-like mRNA interferase family)
MPQEMRFSIVRKLLEDHGWTFVRFSENAHATFEKPGQQLLIVPVKKMKVKACYASRIKKACEE